MGTFYENFLGEWQVIRNSIINHMITTNVWDDLVTAAKCLIHVDGVAKDMLRDMDKVVTSPDAPITISDELIIIQDAPDPIHETGGVENGG